MSVYKRGETYWVQVWYGSGENLRRYRSPAGTSFKEACKAEAAIKAKIAAGDFAFLTPRSAGVSFSEFADRYLETWSRPHKAAKSHERDKGILDDNHFRGFFGKKLLSDITRKDIEAYITRRLDDSSRKGGSVKRDTVNRELAVLKHMFTKAVEWGELEQNTAHKIKPLKGAPGRLQYLKLEEARKLLAECSASPSPHLFPIVLTALHTGGRRGEVLSMRWEQVDFDNRAIKIVATKNNTVRIVPMTDEARECLSKKPHHIKSDLVFFNPEGKELDNFKLSWASALKRAGLEGFRFHDLRHTYASWLAINGVDILTIKELLGHKDIKMTLRYAHLSPWNLKRAGGILNAYWRGESGAALAHAPAQAG
ncbi:MAG: site-specific integrase [Nitrospirae bacterium]|nr:site-specific integrase [Nitrospirota bacterium]